ncbi:MAG: hypothetical protein E6032_13450 [Pseudomonas aeruginosa]|uniref:scabin-related ADP-ribosyltransferase n=1 Tax=Pseudomonas aeruginosa TaxID=287 RepID=UPI000AADECFD|nr:hypothetical protein [Pseudomonas aeruginosa]MBA4944064.1 hypothetical protein [Pseudomonas aeruginosa]MDU5642200.1 hypothetical protein [Pseudomonas aeruginosa]SUD20976.1 Uncharacterised protein [Pseudomonas aeruginosa]
MKNELGLHLRGSIGIFFLTFLWGGVAYAQVSGIADTSGAVTEWVRNSPADEINQALQNAIRNDPVYPNAEITWRPQTVVDYRWNPQSSSTPTQIPREVERLVRWDRRNPNEIFSSGFSPQRSDAWDDSEMNLSSYVRLNSPSFFTGTTRYIRRSTTNQVYHWTPRNRLAYWEYEIFAPGGIDVNLSLGPTNPYANQNEVAFPGGVLPRYIRLARHYAPSSTPGSSVLDRMLLNPSFIPVVPGVSSSGADISVGRTNYLPEVSCRSSRVDITLWDGSNGGDSSSRDTRSADDNNVDDNNYDDIMRGDGEFVVDDDAVDVTSCNNLIADDIRVLRGSIKIDSPSIAANTAGQLYGDLVVEVLDSNLEDQQIFYYVSDNPFPIVYNSGKWETPTRPANMDATGVAKVNFTNGVATVCLKTKSGLFNNGTFNETVMPAGTSDCVGVVIDHGQNKRIEFTLENKALDVTLTYSANVIGY